MSKYETIMTKGTRYEMSAELKREITEEARDLFDEYMEGYANELAGLPVILRVVERNKGWFIHAMEKHPSYNGRLQIVLKEQSFYRYASEDVVREFRDWVDLWLDDHKILITPEGKMTQEEYAQFFKRLRYRRDMYVGKYRETDFRVYKLGYLSMMDKMDNMRQMTHNDIYFTGLRKAMMTVLDTIVEDGGQFLESELKEKIDGINKEYTLRIKGIHEGQRISRLIAKLGNLLGIDKFTDIREETWTDQSGNRHSRHKDYGWNKKFAAFSDAINPLEFKGTIVISVNPIDFWTMSFGYKWASCHTIDKRNLRMADHAYHGMYCGGTESYMLDESTIIVYMLPENFEGKPELQDKIKRCVFYLGEDKIIQSRVYPDGRDGGDSGIQAQLRAIMQKLISDIFDVPNYWHLEKGTVAASSMINSDGVHYRDYENYDDCNVSFMKRIDGFINRNRINVGHAPICPECGEEHWEEDEIFCSDCRCPQERCAQCGNYDYRSDMREIDGDWYCSYCWTECEDCYEAVPTENICECLGSSRNYTRCVCDSCVEDRYTWSEEEDMYIDDDYAITTEEGDTFHISTGGEDWFTCPGCGVIHSASAGTEINGTMYCDDCAENIETTEEGGEE